MHVDCDYDSCLTVMKKIFVCQYLYLCAFYTDKFTGHTNWVSSICDLLVKLFA